MSYTTTHGEIQRRLSQRLRRWLKLVWDENASTYQFYYDRRTDLKQSISKETEHRGSFPSGKQKVRTDVELELPNKTLAFEVKMTKSDVKNWFTQRSDYRAAGLSPALVLSKKLAYELVPHQSATLQDSYLIIDERENEWYWNHEFTPPSIDSQFTVGDPITNVDECPECGCWINSTDGIVLTCVNCHWRASVEALEQSRSPVAACWKCGRSD